MTTENEEIDFRQSYWEEVYKNETLREEIELLKQKIKHMEMQSGVYKPKDNSLNSYPVFISDIVVACIEITMSLVPDCVEKTVVKTWLSKIENEY